MQISICVSFYNAKSCEFTIIEKWTVTLDWLNIQNQHKIWIISYLHSSHLHRATNQIYIHPYSVNNMIGNFTRSSAWSRRWCKHICLYGKPGIDPGSCSPMRKQQASARLIHDRIVQIPESDRNKNVRNIHIAPNKGRFGALRGFNLYKSLYSISYEQNVYQILTFYRDE